MTVVVLFALLVVLLMASGEHGGPTVAGHAGIHPRGGAAEDRSPREVREPAASSLETLAAQEVSGAAQGLPAPNSETSADGPTSAPTPLETTPDTTPESTPAATAATVNAQRDLRDLVASCEPSVVRIDTFDGSQRVGTGSGFVVHEDGHVLTNLHVLESARSASVHFPDGQSTPVKGVLAVASQKDLALIKIDRPKQRLKPLALAAALPEKGEAVVAFGAPLGLSFTVTEGIVSALRTGAELDEALGPGFREHGFSPQVRLIQTSAPISPGNSGGPLVTLSGEVVGINTLGSSGIGQNLNFAVSSLDLAELLAGRVGPLRPLTGLPQIRLPQTPTDRSGPNIVDGTTTIEGRKLLARLSKVALRHAVTAGNPFIDASGRLVATTCKNRLAQGGFDVVEEVDRNTAVLAVELRFDRLGRESYRVQIMASLYQPRTRADGELEIVRTWEEHRIRSLNSQFAAQSGYLDREIYSHLTSMCRKLEYDARRAAGR